MHYSWKLRIKTDLFFLFLQSSGGQRKRKTVGKQKQVVWKYINQRWKSTRQFCLLKSNLKIHGVIYVVIKLSWESKGKVFKIT